MALTVSSNSENSLSMSSIKGIQTENTVDKTLLGPMVMNGKVI